MPHTQTPEPPPASLGKETPRKTASRAWEGLPRPGGPAATGVTFPWPAQLGFHAQQRGEGGTERGPPCPPRGQAGALRGAARGGALPDRRTGGRISQPQQRRPQGKPSKWGPAGRKPPCPGPAPPQSPPAGTLTAQPPGGCSRGRRGIKGERRPPLRQSGQLLGKPSQKVRTGGRQRCALRTSQAGPAGRAGGGPRRTAVASPSGGLSPSLARSAYLAGLLLGVERANFPFSSWRKGGRGASPTHCGNAGASKGLLGVCRRLSDCPGGGALGPPPV